MGTNCAGIVGHLIVTGMIDGKLSPPPPPPPLPCGRYDDNTNYTNLMRRRKFNRIGEIMQIPVTNVETSEINSRDKVVTYVIVSCVLCALSFRL